MCKKNHSKLWLYFTGIVFATIFVVFILVMFLWIGLYRCGLIPISPGAHRAPFLLFSLGSLLLGCVIAIYVGKLIIRPIQNMGDAFDELSRGNFLVKVPEDEKLMEIREMAQRFNAMAYDLGHIETLRSDFVANVSHEFKTPIAAIEGYATLLQNPNITKEKHDHYVKIILDNTRRLSSMSGNILLLSKLENQETVMDKTEYRLDEQIRECILTLERKWDKKEIELDLNLPKISYYGSKPLLEQVWLNILDNAIRHTPARGCIRVTLVQGNASVRVSIADNGCGMSEAVQRHIFEKFYQGDPSRKSDGNGLGLALVNRIIVLCKGDIQVHSAMGKGSEFMITLPNRLP